VYYTLLVFIFQNSFKCYVIVVTRKICILIRSVVKIAGKITFAQKLSCLNPKGMATESSEGNITAYRALIRHLNEARDADSVMVQEIPGGGSSSEQV